ncbi:SRPBCC family protein [Knoellia locipacati]|uniref:SRPBCC family protein n=1 Tax=Knoellia locipacati TaxID=882824 RepID=UPI00384A91B9
MGTISHEIWVDTSPEDLWRVYADPRRILEWQTGSPVVEVVVGDGMSTGSSYTSRRGRLSSHTVVRDATPPHRLVTWTVASLGLRFTLLSELTPEHGGTRLALRVTTRWPRGLGVVGRVVERALLSGGEATKELARLKELVERGR